MVWHDRATGHLGKDRPDIRALLLWAERQDAEITQDREAAGAREANLREGEEMVNSLSEKIFEGIKYAISDTLLGKARSCPGRGLEL